MRDDFSFDKFLSDVDPDDNEVYCLYTTVRDEDENGFGFSCVRRDDKLFLTNTYDGARLILGSDRAKEAFLATIVDRYCDGLDIDSWVGINHALGNDAA